LRWGTFDSAKPKSGGAIECGLASGAKRATKMKRGANRINDDVIGFVGDKTTSFDVCYENFSVAASDRSLFLPN
jgi:hypothetical protein